jgi:hypothetical protein
VTLLQSQERDCGLTRSRRPLLAVGHWLQGEAEVATGQEGRRISTCRAELDTAGIPA